MSSPRIFIDGNEERAKWHLPVIEAEFRSFVMRCKKAGLKQDRFTMRFEEDGTVVFGQYFYGSESIQIYSPGKTVVVKEKSKDDLSVKVKPKTFWVNTNKGYYWVEVRYIDSVPKVILTAFTGQNEDGSFVYPGIGVASPGMIAGTIDDSEKSRYILTQDGEIIVSDGDSKGIVKSTKIVDSARITPVITAGVEHEYVLILQNMGQSAEVRKIKISFVNSEFTIEREYASIDMMFEGETLSPESLNVLPAWVHRKCSGSYFSPNKTIGYHVDIGTDDAFMGNIYAARGINMLDNTGGFEEELFNHTKDLYRIANLLSFPRPTEGDNISLFIVTPTMGFDDDQLISKKCWGGYGITADWCGCADYGQDFSSWFLSPRLVLVTVNLKSGERTFKDFGFGNSVYSSSVDIESWDKSFKAKFYIKAEFLCNGQYYNNNVTHAADDQCSWTEDCGWTCDTNDPGSSGQCSKGWTPYNHWEYYQRENIKIKKSCFFLFGSDEPNPNLPESMTGFFFMFDGLWHLDIGVLWTTARIVGDYCGLCMYPYGSQDPGGLVTFSVQGVNADWVAAHGHEFVENMEIVTPLGWIPWPLGGETLGFVAKVPEDYAAPHDPVMMIGGVEYQSQDVPDEVVRCQRALMSSPCVCAGNDMTFDEYSVFVLGQTGTVQIIDGCPPFEWSAVNAKIAGKAYQLTDQRTFSVVVDDDCSASIFVKDACGTEQALSDAYSLSPLITGETILDRGEQAVYTHNLEDAVYTGTLEVIEISGNSALLRMPANASYATIYTASWSGKCGTEVSMNVMTVPECALDYDHVCVWGLYGYGPPPRYVNSRTLCINYMGYAGLYCLQFVTIIDSSIHGTAFCKGKSAGDWTFGLIPGYMVGHTMLECISDADDDGYWHVGYGGPDQCC